MAFYIGNQAEHPRTFSVSCLLAPPLKANGLPRHPTDLRDQNIAVATALIGFEAEQHNVLTLCIVMQVAETLADFLRGQQAGLGSSGQFKVFFRADEPARLSLGLLRSRRWVVHDARDGSRVVYDGLSKARSA